ncbi:histidine kinase [Oculatella sp. LEGE 06141]|uniref:histidine kinase n=1 Tax=Oculatella sp. LEGE 06141 TaxID=1828648 RepID=UPI0018809F0E|nr:histidine kinase [Oculatella sp. LEGE 06141]MBE9179669.1 histidine kinase [Oculatella sp. LEGE 06141]
MPNSVREQIKTDLNKAKDEGQLRSERIREIVRAAVMQSRAELREGSIELRSIIKEAIAAVVEAFQERGHEAKEDITASIEGAIEGMSQTRRESIAKIQTEIQTLQTQVDSEETALQTEIDGVLTDIETTGKGSSADVNATIEAAVESVKDSEEVALMRKRYAQLQAQLAILRANLSARYGEQYEDVTRHLDEAKTWYANARSRAEAEESTVLERRQTEFEQKIGEAGSAVARRERRVKQVLKELWHSASEAFQEKTKTPM